MNQTKSKVPFILLIIFSLGNIMAVLDTTGVGLAIPHIADTYHVSIVNSNWIINTYTLALGSFLMLAGGLTNKFGAKNILIFGMTVFTLSSLACSISPNLPFLIAARFIQGIGAALFMPSNLALLYTSFPDKTESARMLGIWSAIIAVATGTGSLIGGAIISAFGWHGIFLLNIPLGILTIIAVLLLVKKNARDSQTKIPLANHILLITTLASFIIYLIQGQQYGWFSNPWIFFFIATIIFATLLVLFENKSQNPIAPKLLLKNAAFLVSNLFGLVVNISLYSIVLVLGLYLQNSLHLSAKDAGAAILPGMILLVAGSMYYSSAVKKNSPNKLAKIALSLAFIASSMIFLLLFFTQNVPLWQIIIIFSIIGIGVGILTPASTTILMSSAGEKYASTASATLNANKQIGGLFGSVIVSLILLQFNENWTAILATTFAINIILYFCALIAAFTKLKNK